MFTKRNSKNTFKNQFQRKIYVRQNTTDVRANTQYGRQNTWQLLLVFIVSFG